MSEQRPNGFERRYPELLLFDESARKAIVMNYSRKCGLIGGLTGFPLFLFGFALFQALGAITPFPWIVKVLIVSCPVGLIGGMVLRWLLHKPFQRQLRDELSDRGIAVCMGCGYDLRAQTEPRCPECGMPFDPHLLDQAKAARQILNSYPQSRGAKMGNV